MTYNPRIKNLDNGVVQVSGTTSAILDKVQTPIVKVTGSVQLNEDVAIVLADASSTNITLTLPPAESVAGLEYTIKKIDSDKELPTYDYFPSTFKEKQVLSGSLAIQTGDRFGYSVALNAAGDIGLIGAYFDETGSNGLSSGTAYIFRSSSTGWREEAILSGSLATGSNDYFGWSVALNAAGDIALIGAWGDETGSNGTPDAMGLAYIFTSGSTGWKEEAILSGSLATGSSDNFGISVALNSLGDIALVGAWQDETGSNGTPDAMGLSYIFRSGSTGWREEAILSGSLATGIGDRFGVSVALNALGNIALIGAYLDETGSNGTPDAMGLAYIFTSGSTGWKEEAILSGSLATVSNDYFGWSVALNAAGNIALVGARDDETGSNGSPNAMGLSYIFRSGSTGWKEEAILSGSLATGINDYFGYSVALNAAGDIALIGARDDETGSNSSLNMGLSYIFTSGSTGWKEEVILSGSLAIQGNDYFGVSVALNATGDIGLIGAYFDETGSINTTGLSYIFQSDYLPIDSGKNTVNITPYSESNAAKYKESILSGSLATGSLDRFGRSVALNAAGDIALIGARGDETGSNGTPDGMGLSYIFRSGSTGWKEEAILSGSLATGSGDSFGNSVALNALGDIALVGAYNDETGSNGTPDAMGLSYIFRSGSTGWKEEAILSGSFATGSSDQFGYSVALNAAGNIALIGALQDETGSDGTPDAMGLAYIFTSGSTGWKEEAILSGSLATGSSDNFGISVALNALGNIALVGAYNDETGSNGTPDAMGLSYIFRSGSTGWREEAILSGSLATGSADYFGISVALNAAGNIALVGAYFDETGSNGLSSGTAYIFTSGSTGWQQEAVLSGSLATGSSDRFGNSVALNALGNIALIGAYNDETGSNGTPNGMGLSYIFRSGSTGWQQEAILSGSLATGSFDSFGQSVALNALGNIALIGAFQDETGSNGTPDGMGLSYIYQYFDSSSIQNSIEGKTSIDLKTQNEAINLISDGSGSWWIF